MRTYNLEDLGFSGSLFNFSGTDTWVSKDIIA
jgi:hypothetical protein